MSRSYGTIAALVVLAALGYSAGTAQGRGHIEALHAGSAAAASGFRLFVLDESHGARLLPIDDRRLSLVRGDTPIAVGPLNRDASPPQVLQSDDGGTIAAFWLSSGILRTRAVWGPARKSSFRLPSGVFPEGLSQHGSTLYAVSKDRWYAVDTASGRVLSTIDLPCCEPVAYNGGSGRLYVLLPGTGPPGGGPDGAPRVIAYDTASGRSFASLSLPQVADGRWQMGTAASGEKVYASWTPGFALSPDGRQIAVYDPQCNCLTLIDARSLRVERSESVTSPQHAVNRLLAWLGLTPEAAEAKGLESGADMSMRYSPDGHLLYLTGYRYSSGDWNDHSIGVRAIEVADGRVTGHALQGQAIWWMRAAPDGSALYALSPGADGVQYCPCYLRRLDPRTLQVDATTMRLPYTSPQLFVLSARR